MVLEKPSNANQWFYQIPVFVSPPQRLNPRKSLGNEDLCGDETAFLISLLRVTGNVSNPVLISDSSAARESIVETSRIPMKQLQRKLVLAQRQHAVVICRQGKLHSVRKAFLQFWIRKQGQVFNGVGFNDVDHQHSIGL